MRGKKTPKEVKIEAIKRLSRGEDENNLAAEFGVMVSTIREWAKTYPVRRSPKRHRANPTKKNTGKSDSELMKENAKLKKDVEFWKNQWLDMFRQNAEGGS